MDSEFLNDTTFIISEGQGRFGPDLPMPLSDHCIIKISDEVLLVTGGFNGTHPEDFVSGQKKTWFLNTYY